VQEIIYNTLLTKRNDCVTVVVNIELKMLNYKFPFLIFPKTDFASVSLCGTIFAQLVVIELMIAKRATVK